MPFFYTEQKFQSEQNGELRYQRYWDGSWLIKVPEGMHYSGNYLEKMWRSVPCRYVDVPPKNVLILGCGACCAIDSVLKLWPDAEVDALDYDPTIVNIGKTIYKNFNGKKVNLIIGEAKKFVIDGKKQYDLILIDLFQKNQPSPLLKEKQFLYALKNIIRGNSAIIVNLATFFKPDDKSIFQAWQDTFPCSVDAQFRSNKLKVYVKKNIPEDYYNMHQSEPYAESLKQKGMIVIGKPQAYYYVQPLFFKTCVVTAMHTDLPPDVDLIKKETGMKHGLIIWSPWKLNFANRPWRKLMLPPIHVKGNGLAYVDTNYRDRWDQTARRDLKKFLNSDAKIRSVSQEEFINALMESKQKSSIKSMFKGMIEKLSKAKMQFWIAEKDRRMLSGLAVMDYDNISVHLAAFISKNDDSAHAGTGLIDHWFKYALNRGLKYLNFGHIRQSGEPRAWQGYSDFKRKFIDEEIVIRNQYFRFF